MNHPYRSNERSARSDEHPNLFWRATVPTLLLFCGLMASHWSERAEVVLFCTLAVVLLLGVVVFVAQVLAVVAFELFQIPRSGVAKSMIAGTACALVGWALVYLSQMPGWDS